MAIILIINSDENSGKQKLQVQQKIKEAHVEVGYTSEENRVHFVTEVWDRLKKTCLLASTPTDTFEHMSKFTSDNITKVRYITTMLRI